MFNATRMLTFKANSVPRFSHGLHPSLPAADWPLAHTTFHTKQFLVILLAVRFSSINIEALRANGFTTVTADEMIRMESLAHRLNTRPAYRLLASVAMRSKILIEVLFTVKLSSFFNEALVLK